MTESENIKLKIAEVIQEGFGLVSIYEQIHQKDGSLYRPLKEAPLRRLVLETCKEYTPIDKISRNLINDVVFYLNTNVIPEKDINPENKFSFNNGELYCF